MWQYHGEELKTKDSINHRINLTGDAGDELMVGVDAVTQVFKEETAMQCSSFQMPPDVTVTISKVLALIKEWLCMRNKPKLCQVWKKLQLFSVPSFLPSQVRLQWSLLLSAGQLLQQPDHRPRIPAEVGNRRYL